MSQDPRVRSEENFKLTKPVKQDYQHLRIAYFCIPRHKEWDTELLEEIFTLVDAQAIASIPLSSGTEPNSIIWHFNKRGTYTVKSGYKVLRKITRPSSQWIASDAWSKLWAVGFPPKVKQFMWSVCTECLPTRPKLRTKGIPINDACSLCDHPSEAAMHLFLECPYARECWNLANVSLIPEWMLSTIVSKGKDELAHIGTILWGIWNERNSRIWRSTRMPPAQRVQTSLARKKPMQYSAHPSCCF